MLYAHRLICLVIFTVESMRRLPGKAVPLASLSVLWREKHPEGKEQLYLPLDSELPGETGQLSIPV